MVLLRQAPDDARPRQGLRAMSITEGNDELLRLADLLLIGSDTTRRIADLRPFDRDELYAMVARAREMAAELQDLCQRAVEAGRRAN